MKIKLERKYLIGGLILGLTGGIIYGYKKYPVAAAGANAADNTADNTGDDTGSGGGASGGSTTPVTPDSPIVDNPPVTTPVWVVPRGYATVFELQQGSGLTRPPINNGNSLGNTPPTGRPTNPNISPDINPNQQYTTGVVQIKHNPSQSPLVLKGAYQKPMNYNQTLSVGGVHGRPKNIPSGLNVNNGHSTHIGSGNIAQSGFDGVVSNPYESKLHVFTAIKKDVTNNSEATSNLLGHPKQIWIVKGRNSESTSNAIGDFNPNVKSTLRPRLVLKPVGTIGVGDYNSGAFNIGFKVGDRVRVKGVNGAMAFSLYTTPHIQGYLVSTMDLSIPSNRILIIEDIEKANVGGTMKWYARVEYDTYHAWLPIDIIEKFIK